MSKMYLKIDYWGNLLAQVLYLSKKAYFAGTPSSVSYSAVIFAEKKYCCLRLKSQEFYFFYFFSKPFQKGYIGYFMTTTIMVK